MKTTGIALVLLVMLFSGIISGQAVSIAKQQDDLPVITSVPRSMTYQGILKDSGGDPVTNQTVDIIFSIFDDPLTGMQEWTVTVLGVQTDEGGYITTTLSNVNLPFDEDYWLELEIDSEVLTPRQKINMSAYAAVADTSDYSWDSDLLDGQEASDFALVIHNHDLDYVNEGQADAITSGMIVDGSITFEDIGANGAAEDQVMKYQGGNWIAADDETGGGIAGWVDDGSTVRLETLSDDVGIGTITPSEKLQVNGRIYVKGNTVDEGITIGNDQSNDNSAHLVWFNNEGLSIHSWGRSIGDQLFIDGNSSYIGIGTSSPDEKLHVAGSIYVTGKARIGYNNTNAGLYAFVAGYNNTASETYASVSGGADNTASGERSTVSGGGNNIASGTRSTIGGGWSNIASGSQSTICGGFNNTVSGENSFIGCGHENLVEGHLSVIPGGQFDTISVNADIAMAFGNRVFLDNSFRVAFFRGSFPGRFGVNRDDHDGGINYPIHIGTSSMNGNGAYLTNGGTWTNGSSRSFKENLQVIESQALFTKIASLEIPEWDYLDTNEHHIGPMAEDFVEAFGVGAIRESDGQREDQYLAASDVAGVALAGVQALLERIEQLEKEIEDLKKERR